MHIVRNARRTKRSLGMCVIAVVATCTVASGAAAVSTADPRSTDSAEPASVPMQLAGTQAVAVAEEVGADELIAEIALPSGTVVTVGAAVGEASSPDELAKSALAELALSLEETPSVIPSGLARLDGIESDDARLARLDNVAIEEIVASSTEIVFTEARVSGGASPDVPATVEPGPSVAPKGVAPMAAGIGVWWPAVIQAQSYTNPSGRVGKLAFYWSGPAKEVLINYDSRVTFEPDFVTYNYDKKHYFGDSILSWSSTMPSPYKDTDFLDGSQERVYTIGTSDANDIRSGVTYQTVFITGVGNASTDKAKAVAQIGTHLPNCTSTWCIFGDSSRVFFHKPTAWNMEVPIGTWQSATSANSVSP